MAVVCRAQELTAVGDSGSIATLMVEKSALVEICEGRCLLLALSSSKGTRGPRQAGRIVCATWRRNRWRFSVRG